MPHKPGQFVDFSRERRFVRQLAQVFALVGLLAMAAHRHVAAAACPEEAHVALVTPAHAPFAPVALHPDE